MRDPTVHIATVPLALLLDTDDSLRRAGRAVRDLRDPGANEGSRISPAAVEAVLRGTSRRNPAERALPRHDDTLLRAARALDDLDHRLAGAGIHVS